MAIVDDVKRRLAEWLTGPVVEAPANPPTRARRRAAQITPLQATITRWYQRDIETALRLADGGNLSMAAKLCRSFRHDGVLHGVGSTRTHGLVRLPKRFTGNPDMVAALAGSDDGDPGLFDRMFPAAELALFVWDGIDLGVCLGEMVDVVGHPEPVFRRLDPEFLRYYWHEDAWYYQSTMGMLRINPGDGRWILGLPGGTEQPWNHGLWAALARAYIAKEHAFLHRENFSGKLANPARVAHAPVGASENQRQGFIEKVIAWGINTVFELPVGWEVELVESNGRGYEVFANTILTSNEEIIISYAGQLVTTTGGVGFANTDIHQAIRADLIQSTADFLAHTINTQGIPPWVNRRFGAGALSEPLSVAWNTDPPGRVLEEAKARKETASSIAELNTSLAEYRQRVSILGVMQRAGIEIEAMPPGEAAVSKIDLAPTDKAKVIRVREARANDKLPPFGDERDDMTILELESWMKRKESAADAAAQAQVQPQPVAAQAGLSRYAASAPAIHGLAHGWIGSTIHAYAFKPGEPPRELQLWCLGENSTDYGIHLWTERSVSEVLGRYEARGNLIPIDIEHSCSEDLNPSPDAPPVTGGYARLEIRDGAPWVVFDWSAPAVEQIRTRQRLYLSPEYIVDNETKEIVGLLRVSLVSNPGTHYARMLASAPTKNAQYRASKDAMVDPVLIAALEAAHASGDLEVLGTLIQSLKNLGGEGDAPAADGSDVAAESAPPAEPAEEKSEEEKMAAKAAPDKAPEPKMPQLAKRVKADASDAVKQVNDATEEAKSVIKAAADEFKRDQLLEKEGVRLQPSVLAWAKSQPLSIVEGLLKATPKEEAARSTKATRGAAGSQPTHQLPEAEYNQLCQLMGITRKRLGGPEVDELGRFKLGAMRPRDFAKFQEQQVIAAKVS